MTRLVAPLFVTTLAACANLLPTASTQTSSPSPTAQASSSPALPAPAATEAAAPDTSRIDAEAAKHRFRFVEIPDHMQKLANEPFVNDTTIIGERSRARWCREAVDEMLAAGVPLTYSYVIEDLDHRPLTQTVADLKPKLCDALDAAANRRENAAAQQADAARQRLVDAGINGDKLDLMLHYDVFLPGGAAPDDLRKYAASSSLFVWLTSDPDDDDYVVHTVRKYRFKGNQLVGDSEQTFRRKRGQELGSAAFK